MPSSNILSPVFNPAMAAPVSTTPIRRWSPYDIWDQLYAWWSVDFVASLTIATATVTAWRDIKGGLTPVSAGAAPDYTTAGWLRFNGTDDLLSVSGVGGLPTGATPCEMWALTSQSALAADTGSRTLFGYGGTSTTSRRLRRVVITGTNRGDVISGNGSASNQSIDTTVDFSGRHVLRGRITATEGSISVDGGAFSTPIASVPSTGTTRTRIGCDTAGSPGQLWHGDVHSILVTRALSADDAARLLEYMNARV